MFFRIRTKEVQEAIDKAIEAESKAYELGDKIDFDLKNKSKTDITLNGNETLPDISLKVAMKAAGKWNAKTPVELAAECNQFDLMNAIPVNEVSLRGNMNDFQEEKFGVCADFVKDPDGYVKIIHSLANSIFTPNDSRLKLNEKVTEVHYSLEKEVLPEMMPHEGVFVKTQSGKLYFVKYCIITFSNAVILSNNIKFVPELPVWKRIALEHCPIGYFTKIFVKFPNTCKKFWDESEWIIYVDSIPVPNMKELMKNETSRVTQTEQSEIYKLNPNFLQMRKESASFNKAIRKNENYLKGFFNSWVNLSKQSFYPDCNIILLLLSGELAKSVEEKSDEEISEEVWLVLNTMYGGNEKEIPKPEGIFCSRWSKNPLTMGSFHCISKGVTAEMLLDLSRNVNALHFAGDGADCEFPGYLNGAFKTGELQAKLILQKLQNNP